MKSFVKALILASTLAAVSVPATAHADGYISPFIGVNFGNSSGNGRMNAGADVGWLSNGIIGVEGDFGYAPSFFGNKGTFGANSVMDVMGNVVVAAPIGARRGASVRPYVTVGVGLLRSTIDGVAGGASVSDSEMGLNAGAGAMGFLSPHFGLRGDVRYFRNLTDSSTTNSANIDFGAFHFWRASFGIVLRP